MRHTPRYLRSIGLILLSVVVACGGRIGFPTGSTGAGTGGSGGTATAVGGGPAGTTGSSGSHAGAGAGGIDGGIGGCKAGDYALCGDTCGDCIDCVGTSDANGNPAAGICTLNVDLSRQCTACHDGEACVIILPSPPDIVCVPEVICEAKLMLGENGCLYTDKSTFTGQPIPDASACPAIPEQPLCGGACGACAQGLDCVGRSPTHPIGLCLDVSADLGAIACSFADPACPGAGHSCFIYADSPSDTQNYSAAYGLCLPTAACTGAATSLPGGGACFDAKGNMIAGALP